MSPHRQRHAAWMVNGDGETLATIAAAVLKPIAIYLVL